MNATARDPVGEPRELVMTVPGGQLGGVLTVPDGATGIVLFAHGSGSSRHSPRNRQVAEMLQQAGLATLLMDLLTREEDAVDQYTREFRFNIELLGDRVTEVTDWVAQNPETRDLPIGLFGASTGAAAALRAAAARPQFVRAVVSRGGRPDLAGDSLPRVQAPTLLIVGAKDTQVIQLNDLARRQMQAPVQLVLVPGATHLFEEPGTLVAASGQARDWFLEYLSPRSNFTASQSTSRSGA
ncbi:MAG: alpha/beta family hydrolase [Thermomicrobiales bacterium]